MSGGIVRIDGVSGKKLLVSRDSKPLTLDANSDELEIFYRLSMNRVYYLSKKHIIYFVQSELVDVAGIIKSVLASFDAVPTFDQVFLDRHNYFKGQLRVRLKSNEARAVVVALRLSNIQVEVSL